MRATYVHTNLIAEDWQKLAEFYTRVFGCTLIPPERDYAGPDLDRGTGLTRTRLRGVHLCLPGWGEQGPTLEIYSYSALAGGSRKMVNRAGFGHIAFAVEDVAAARAEVLAQGGGPLGEVVTLTTAAGAQVTWCYVTDPEGNILELQAWKNPE